MAFYIELFGGLIGLFLILYNFVGNVSGMNYIIAGIIVMNVSYIISLIVNCIKYNIIKDSELSKGDKCNYEKIANAKKEVIGSTIRTSIISGATYNSTKKAINNIAHPDHWDKI